MQVSPPATCQETVRFAFNSSLPIHDGVNLTISQHQNYRYWVLQTLADCGLAACLVKIG